MPQHFTLAGPSQISAHRRDKGQLDVRLTECLRQSVYLVPLRVLSKTKSHKHPDLDMLELEKNAPFSLDGEKHVIQLDKVRAAVWS